MFLAGVYLQIKPVQNVIQTVINLLAATFRQHHQGVANVIQSATLGLPWILQHTHAFLVIQIAMDHVLLMDQTLATLSATLPMLSWRPITHVKSVIPTVCLEIVQWLGPPFVIQEHAIQDFIQLRIITVMFPPQQCHQPLQLQEDLQAVVAALVQQP